MNDYVCFPMHISYDCLS